MNVHLNLKWLYLFEHVQKDQLMCQQIWNIPGEKPVNRVEDSQTFL